MDVYTEEHIPQVGITTQVHRKLDLLHVLALGAIKNISGTLTLDTY